MKQTKIMKELTMGLFAVGALAMLYKPVTVNAEEEVTSVNFTVNFNNIDNVSVGQAIPQNTNDNGTFSIAESGKCYVEAEGWFSDVNGSWNTVWDDSEVPDGGSQFVRAGYSDDGKFDDQHTFAYGLEIFPKTGYEMGNNVDFTCTNGTIVYKKILIIAGLSV